MRHRRGPERLLCFAPRSPHAELPEHAEGTRRGADLEPALEHAQREIDAARNGEVPLARIEYAFGHAHRPNDLRQDEVEIGVALAVYVRRLVHGHRTVQRELDVLAVPRIEPAQENLVGYGVAFGPRDVNAGCSREQLGGVAVRCGGEHVDFKEHVTARTRRRNVMTVDVELDRAVGLDP